MTNEVVSVDEFEVAYAKWKAWHKGRGERYGTFFMKFLGISNFLVHPQGYTMPDYAARKLRMLYGPHHHAIIKAYYAQHPEEQQHAMDTREGTAHSVHPLD